MTSNQVKVGIVGLGRWAKVLTRAARAVRRLDDHRRATAASQEKRAAFESEFGVAAAPDLATMLADPEIKGVILTVPNEQHLAARARGRQGRQARLHRKADRQHARGRPRDRGAGEDLWRDRHGRPQRPPDGRHPRIREAIDAGELGRVAFIEANFSNERALELTPKTWRWYKDKAPGGPLSQLAIHQFDVLHYLGGEIVEASSMASKLSPVGAEVDDQSMTLLKFADGKIGYVGSCWTSPGIFAVRVFGSKGLMHYEIDFGTWDTPAELHKTSTLYIQRGKDGYGKREELDVPESDMFRAELDMFAESCRTGKPNELYRAATAMSRSPWSMRRLRSIEQRRPGGAHRRRDRGGARARRRKEPPCCLAATSST